MTPSSFFPPLSILLLKGIGASLALAGMIGGLAPGTTPPARRDSVALAIRALEDGRPYLAYRLLAPASPPRAPRDSATVLLTARAAAGWEGWGTVVQLLQGMPWLDRYAGGEGRSLLARARVERGEDAVEDARAALSRGAADQQAFRQVTLARAFDRAGLLDSASRAYQSAAVLLPTISDWLLLRAAGVERDSLRRRLLYREISLPAALPRIPWTEALARERTNDWRGAARAYADLGATLSSIRSRLHSGAAPDTLAALRREVLQLLPARLSAEEIRIAIGLLDDTLGPLDVGEELLVARQAAEADWPARAASGLSRVARAGKLEDRDRLTWGGVLARLGRHREAMELLAAVRTPPLRGKAGYARARSLLEVGRRTEAITLLRAVSASHRTDTVTAAQAGYLAGELLVDSGDDRRARAEFHRVGRAFPGTGHGARGAFQAALIDFIQGAWPRARLEFDSLAARPGNRSEDPAALYWSGRAAMAAGDTAPAFRQWRLLLKKFPGSYYVLPASRRLGVPAGVTPALGALPPAPDSLLSILDRGMLLGRTGLKVEARFEYDQVTRQAEANPAILPATAAALVQEGLWARAYRLALRSPDSALQRLRYPLPRATVLFEEAAGAGVDPLLAAAIMRQESGFDPSARSRANALGLLQVLPSVGQALARADGLREWDAGLLTQPEINLRFGLAHLREVLDRYPNLEQALAAYNAGSRPANQWMELPGTSDPEVFLERIQYVETRDYVRRVMRNLAVYRAMAASAP